MPKVGRSVSPDITSREDWEKKEAERKQLHSAIERRRRQKIQEQLQILKKLVPSCTARDDNEKLSILQGTADYIKQLQDLLIQYQEKDPSIVPSAARFLPVKPKTTHSILSTLLPNYQPPKSFKKIEDKPIKERPVHMRMETLLC
ncbi:hypothetical protein HK103_000676 [Boothiomyces macroporosus]|uniref:BHLH domain-containing protein n=1 Tax=Boothiomyces macroporosus TaxID=261099 RepID=A0AAD5UBL8_9FUNG|nr:hypothetical protein HK103_000676 [Boothiomyces macroporosus]